MTTPTLDTVLELIEQLPTADVQRLIDQINARLAARELEREQPHGDQPTAHTWIHVLLPVLYATFSANGYLPARTPDALRTYLESLAHHDATIPESLFFAMMPSSVLLSDPLMLMNSVSCTAASGNVIPLKIPL